jgi:hypothetical protein
MLRLSMLHERKKQFEVEFMFGNIIWIEEKVS